MRGVGLVALVIGLVSLGPVLAQQTAPPALSLEQSLRQRLFVTETALEQALAQAASCRVALRSVQLSSDEAKLRGDVETAHPGFTFDTKTGALVAKAPQE